MVAEVKPEGSIDALDLFIEGEAKINSGLVSFAAINSYIHKFNWGFFVVDDDPAHEEPHPVDEHLLSQQKLGKIIVNMDSEQIMVHTSANI